MREIDYGAFAEVSDDLRRLRRFMDGTCYRVRPFIEENGKISEKKTKLLAKNILECLPFSSRSKQYKFYSDYLYMALVLAGVQLKAHDETYGYDFIYECGLGYDVSFAGIINRAYINDRFLAEKYGTILVTGTIDDLDGYLDRVYKDRQKRFAFDVWENYHPVFGGIGNMVELLDGTRELDQKKDRYASEGSYELFLENFPDRKPFIDAYTRYRENYFVPGVRDNFQDNIADAVKKYLISEHLSMFDEDDEKKEQARKELARSVRAIGRLL